jgi:hypothetical protein
MQFNYICLLGCWDLQYSIGKFRTGTDVAPPFSSHIQCKLCTRFCHFAFYERTFSFVSHAQYKQFLPKQKEFHYRLAFCKEEERSFLFHHRCVPNCPTVGVACKKFSSDLDDLLEVAEQVQVQRRRSYMGWKGLESLPCILLVMEIPLSALAPGRPQGSAACAASNVATRSGWRHFNNFAERGW